MAYIAYVFTVDRGRSNRYKIPLADIEIRAISAMDLEVRIVDTRGGAAKSALIADDKVELGTSVVLGRNMALEFINNGRKPTDGYVGGVM